MREADTVAFDDEHAALLRLHDGVADVGLGRQGVGDQRRRRIRGRSRDERDLAGRVRETVDVRGH
jgi:hypothetical protein